MGWLDDGWITLVRGLKDAGRCLQQPFSIGACDFFWPAAILAVILTGLVGLFLIARVFLRDYLVHRRAAARWRAEQEIAAPEIMEQAKWRGDSASTEDLSQAELTARIKEQLAKQRQKVEGEEPSVGALGSRCRRQRFER